MKRSTVLELCSVTHAGSYKIQDNEKFSLRNSGSIGGVKRKETRLSVKENDTDLYLARLWDPKMYLF